MTFKDRWKAYCDSIADHLRRAGFEPEYTWDDKAAVQTVKVGKRGFAFSPYVAFDADAAVDGPKCAEALTK